MLTRTFRSDALRFTSLLAVLASLATAMPAAADQIPWAPDLETAQAQASRQGRLVLVHFYGENCAPCAQLERNVFSRQDVAQTIASKYIPVKVNATRRRDLARRFDVNRWPTDVVITPSGQKIASMVSPQDPQQYINTFGQIAARMFPPTPPTQTAGLAARSDPEPSTSAYGSRRDLALAGHQTPDYGYSSRYQPAGNPTGGNPSSNQANPNPYQANANANPGYHPSAGSSYQPPRNPAASPYAPPSQEVDTTSPYAPANRYAPPQQPAAQGNPYGAPPAAAAGPANASRYGAPAAANRGQSTIAAQPSLSASSAPQGAEYQPRYANQPSPNGPPVAVSQPERKVQDTVNPYAQSGAPQSPRGQARQVWEWQNETTPPASEPRVASNTPAGNPPQQAQRQGQPQAANQAPLALDGFCPVALNSENPAWVEGDKRFGAVHRGRTYLFHSQAAQEAFLQDADRYAPALSGYDPVRFVEERKIVPGTREFGWFYEGRYYLFADEAGLLRFEKTPERYHEIVQQAMHGGPQGGNQYR